MTQQLKNKEKCSICGKNSIVTDIESGELFCAKCGFVINEKVFDNSIGRIFLDNPINKIHTGDKTTLTRHDGGLSTIINPINKDSTGKPLSASMKSSITRLRIWDSRSRAKDSTDRNLQYAFKELLKMKEKLFLSDVIVEKAAYIYRKAMEKELVKGRTISSLIAAALYAACRESGTPRTLKEVSNSINIKRKNLALCYRLLVKELDLKMPVIDSVSCIAKIASNANLSEKTKRHAMKILKKAEEEKILAGKDPMGMAASALYVASLEKGENITQKILAEAAGVTEVTIRIRSKNLKNLFRILNKFDS